MTTREFIESKLVECGLRPKEAAEVVQRVTRLDCCNDVPWDGAKEGYPVEVYAWKKTPYQLLLVELAVWHKTCYEAADRIDEQDAKIKRLRKERRTECTEFASIVGVDDSRDTRIVLADSKVKLDTLREKAAAVIKERDKMDLPSVTCMPDGLGDAIQNLRIVADLPPSGCKTPEVKL